MNTDPNCIFCQIVAGQIPSVRVYDNEHTVAFMDINPVADGHVLVIPKRHSQNLYEISPSDLAHTSASIQHVARAVKAVFSPDGITINQANDKGAAQSVMHFHMHIVPRKIGDDLKINWGLKPGDMERIQTLAQLIRDQLQVDSDKGSDG